MALKQQYIQQKCNNTDLNQVQQLPPGLQGKPGTENSPCGGGGGGEDVLLGEAKNSVAPQDILRILFYFVYLYCSNGNIPRKISGHFPGGAITQGQHSRPIHPALFN